MDYRQRITEEAALMFRTYGIRAVTMDMLASSMGISKRTIYEVFSNKDELLGGVLKWMAVKQQELMKKVFEESGNVIEAIFKLLDIMSEHFRNMSPAFQMDMRKYHNDIIRKLNENDEFQYYSNNMEVIKRGINEGVFRDNIDMEITNKCLLEVIRMSNDKDVFPPDDFLSKDVLRNFYVNFIRGISTPKGLELIDFYDKKKLK